MSPRLLALVGALCLAASPLLARAEEAPAPAPAPEPAPAADEEYVEHTGYDMALAEAGLPKGWTMGEGDAAAKAENAVKDAVLALAKAAGVGELGVHAVARSAKAPEGQVVWVLVDLEKRSEAFGKAVSAAAKEKGWDVREMGASVRLLVVAAPEAVRAAAVEAQVRWAARMLATKAWSAIEYRNAERAVVLAKAAVAMDPKSAGGNLVLGEVALAMASQSQDPKGYQAAVERLTAATAADASAPLTGAQAAVAWGDLGSALLLVTGRDAQARDALKKAVASSADLDRAAALGHRYNLACAHGRLKEVDDAFAALTVVLAEQAKNPIRGIDHWREDPDFANLKADPRWARLLETYGASAAPKGD